MSTITKQAVQAIADLKSGYTLGHADVEIIQQMALEAVTLLDELEAKEKQIDEQREIMRQAASDISYAIFNLTGSDLSRLNPGVVETTDPTDTALIAERNLRAAAAGIRSATTRASVSTFRMLVTK
ncbi:hypothetical protein [Enterobacter roggenkampii]|uniref:hypothetical protein n=1 Tax=Enterobacter roggenkampii TaxID=1812935 RepID=UPI001C9A8EC4|nr:hypothetical protein [Enterobacter roggenkampii]MBY7252013.1 hypothetical protein [Enterobacter roggenkampii]